MPGAQWLWSDSTMGGWSARWLVYAVAVVGHARGCNVREISELVQRRFREEIAAQCGSIGDECTFDRECCKGLECSMSVSAVQGGVGLSCQRAWLADPDRGDMAWGTPDSSPRAAEPKSDDGNWFVVKSEEEEDRQESTEERDEKTYPTDMLTEIENLREKKKLKLLRENYELEKLFTEREEKELEQLRALREDADMDELRKLKELRLKRKMRLIEELKELRGLKAEEDLKELRGLKAEEDLKTLKKVNKVTNVNETEEEPSIRNPTDELEPNYDNNWNASTSVEGTQSPDMEPEPGDVENAPKHKQGIREHQHKRKHHHHKREDSTNRSENDDPENNVT